MTKTLALVTALALAFVTAGTGHAQETPRMGGVLKVATIGEPPTLDIPGRPRPCSRTRSCGTSTRRSSPTTRSFNPVPLLAESHAVTDRGLRHTITLRKGVKFHNGKEMTAADVVPVAQALGPGGHGRQAAVGRTSRASRPRIRTRSCSRSSSRRPRCIFGLAEPHGGDLSRRRVVEAAGDGPLKEYIGTGPYRFVEHRPDRHIKLARFKEYAARSRAGQRLRRQARRRSSTRSCSSRCPTPRCGWPASETGEYHHGDVREAGRLRAHQGACPQLEPRIVKPRGWAVAVLNHKAGAHDGQEAPPGRSRPRSTWSRSCSAASATRTSTASIPACSSPSSRGTPRSSATLYNQHDARQGAAAR